MVIMLIMLNHDDKIQQTSQHMCMYTVHTTMYVWRVLVGKMDNVHAKKEKEKEKKIAKWK